MTELSTDITAVVSAVLTQVLTPGQQARVPMGFATSDRLDNDQADLVYASFDRVLAADTLETFDLVGGGLTDALGNSLSFAEVKVLAIKALGSNAEALEVGGNGVSDLGFLGAGDVLFLNPGGYFLVTAPEVGYTVVPATADAIQVKNLSLTDPATYSICIIGKS